MNPFLRRTSFRRLDKKSGREGEGRKKPVGSREKTSLHEAKNKNREREERDKTEGAKWLTEPRKDSRGLRILSEAFSGGR